MGLPRSANLTSSATGVLAKGLAEGAGRNAVRLAGRGHEVTAVDASAVGIAKAETLARARGVKITMAATDLAVYTIEPGFWAGIVAIFVHLPPALRRAVHRGGGSRTRPRRGARP